MGLFNSRASCGRCGAKIKTSEGMFGKTCDTQCPACGAQLTGQINQQGIAVPAQSLPAFEPHTPAPVRTVSVVLDHPGKKKISVIKVVRERTSTGLAEAKELVDRSEQGPTFLMECPEPQAREFVAKLEAAGAQAHIDERADAGDAGGADEAAAAPAQVSGPTIPTQISKLADLHAAGALTDEEFRQQTTELLGRM